MRKSVVSLEEADLVRLEGIIMDDDEREASIFLRKKVYDRIVQEQQGRLKSHLDGGQAVEGFARDNR